MQYTFFGGEKQSRQTMDVPISFQSLFTDFLVQNTNYNQQLRQKYTALTKNNINLTYSVPCYNHLTIGWINPWIFLFVFKKLYTDLMVQNINNNQQLRWIFPFLRIMCCTAGTTLCN